MDPEYHGYADGDVPLRSREAGERAVDLPLRTLGGETVRLADLWNRGPIVLEFGSITCPVFRGHVDRMDELAARFDEVGVHVVYTQEEHPDAAFPLQGTLEEKLERARTLRERDGIERSVLVDDMAGTVHRAYTTAPNAAHVIGRDGVVSYGSDWMDPDDLSGHLETLLAAGGEGAAVDPTDRRDNVHEANPNFGD